MTEPAGRIVAIDMLKGAALVGVILIHADLPGGTLPMTHLINHAVPVFVVLTGLNSERWWTGRPPADVGTWLRTRARRLYPPVWAAVAVWWAIALCADRPLGPLSWTLAVHHVAGDLQWIDTGWFVPLIVQLLLLFPLLHFAARRVGHLPVLVAGLACLLAAVSARFALLDALGWNGLLLFSPRMFGHLAFGMLLAHHLDWLTPRGALLALLLVVPGWLVHGGVVAPALGEHASWLLDLPLTVVLLVAMDTVADRPWIARPLTWLGVHSWGLYLAQMLVIAAIASPLGRAWASAHLAPAIYATILLAGAIALVRLGDALLDLLRRFGEPRLVTRPWRRALVVGASSGIGAELARQLGAAGCHVALVARRRDELAALAEAIDAAPGAGRASIFPYDVTHYDGVPDLFRTICHDLGGLELCVYSAGVMPRIEADEYTFGKDRTIVEVNVLGAMAWLNEAAQRFERGGTGTIVGISSVAGDRGRRGNPAYHASKAALDAYLEALRNRLGQFGVRVVTIKPGPVDTEMTRGMDRLPLLVSVESAATQILDAAARGTQVAYVPARWRPIMFVLRNIPSPIFRLLDI